MKKSSLFLGEVMSSPVDQTLGATILVADDQAPNRELLEALLSADGFQVVQAADGEQALSALADNPIDLVLLDVMMPRLNGFEVCERIKSNPDLKSIPIIVVTSYALSGDEDKARSAGCDDYVAKPYSPRQLLAKIRAYV